MADKSETKQPPAAWKNTVAGAVGGISVVVSGHPLDTLKVKLQTQQVAPGQKPLYTGAWDCAVKTVKKDGVRGLYRGIWTPLVGVTPIFSLCFTAYGFGQNLQRTPGKELTLLQHWNAGMLAGVATTVIMAPGERIKCLLQTQGDKYKSTWDCMRAVYREGGIRGVFRGSSATLLRDVPGTAAYFASYEYLKVALTPEGEEPGKLSPARLLVAGGLAGMANWAVAIPADVVKSRIQIAEAGTYSGVIDCTQKLIKAEGVGALYKGFVPVMVRAFPANAACFLGFEMTLRLLNKFF
eukprot:Nk52_evm25s1837 gene=Nk52_evmTU25s1837